MIWGWYYRSKWLIAIGIRDLKIKYRYLAIDVCWLERKGPWKILRWKWARRLVGRYQWTHLLPQEGVDCQRTDSESMPSQASFENLNLVLFKRSWLDSQWTNWWDGFRVDLETGLLDFHLHLLYPEPKGMKINRCLFLAFPPSFRPLLSDRGLSWIFVQLNASD